MDFADDFVVDDPLVFFFFLNGDFLQISSGLEVNIGHFSFAEFDVIEFSIIDFAEFGVLELFWIC